MRGKIISEWKRDSKTFKLSVTIPPNTTATVFVPAISATNITESGKSFQLSKGVKFLREENNYAVFAVESGTFSFESK